MMHVNHVTYVQFYSVRQVVNIILYSLMRMVHFVIIILRRTLSIFSGIEQTLVQFGNICKFLKNTARYESLLEKTDTVSG